MLIELANIQNEVSIQLELRRSPLIRKNVMFRTVGVPVEEEDFARDWPIEKKKVSITKGP